MPRSRLDHLHASLRRSGLSAVALTPGSTLTYLSGISFHLMERPVVLLVSADQAPVLVLPELEAPKLELFEYPVHAFQYGENPSEWDAVFQKAFHSLGLGGKRIGVEPRQMRLFEYSYLNRNLSGADFPDATDVLAGLRIKKEAAEVEAMRRAVKIAQDALEATLPKIKIGMTEKELSSELVLQLFHNGSESELPFAPIVSCGPNSANPHASPSLRKLQAGDLLVVDWGAASGGYISDLTRTFAVGEVDSEYTRIHKIVQEANAAGRAAAKPGILCAQVDLAAREVIEQSGYGKFFTHRTGHGIGMEAHEAPYIRSDNMQLLEPGMAFTVEPGIYLAGRNGVRIEDNVILTELDADVLSAMPREIRVVG